MTETERIQSQLMDNVARGVALLDRKMPGWWNGADDGSVTVGRHRIDVADLALHSGRRCVLGQLSPIRDYYTQRDYLGLDDELAVVHGFTLDYPFRWVMSRWWSFLTEVWIAVIASRRLPERTKKTTPDWIAHLNRKAKIEGWAA